MWQIIGSMANDISLMQGLAFVCFVVAVTMTCAGHFFICKSEELKEECEALQTKLTAARRDYAKGLKLREKIMAELLEEDRVWVDQWKARAEWFERQCQQSNKLSSNNSVPPLAAERSEVEMKFPKNLDEMQESFKQGEKLMSKIRKQKSLIREVGFIRAVMMFGLGYVLASMIKETWDRIKHRFEDDAKGSGREDSTD